MITPRLYSWVDVNILVAMALAGKNLSLAHIRVFGCDSFLHVLTEKRRKLNRKSNKCIFTGYNH